MERAEEQQGRVQGAQPSDVSSITATAGEGNVHGELGGEMDMGARYKVSKGQKMDLREDRGERRSE